VAFFDIRLAKVNGNGGGSGSCTMLLWSVAFILFSPFFDEMTGLWSGHHDSFYLRLGVR